MLLNVMKKIKLGENCLICDGNINYRVFTCDTCSNLLPDKIYDISSCYPDHIPEEQREQWLARRIIKYYKEDILNERNKTT